MHSLFFHSARLPSAILSGVLLQREEPLDPALLLSALAPLGLGVHPSLARAWERIGILAGPGPHTANAPPTKPPSMGTAGSTNPYWHLTYESIAGARILNRGGPQEFRASNHGQSIPFMRRDSYSMAQACQRQIISSEEDHNEQTVQNRSADGHVRPSVSAPGNRGLGQD